jgi:REP element-mobilizing transposase RayT
MARLHHGIPGWVKAGATFHLRLRFAPIAEPELPALAGCLLSAARTYHDLGRWHLHLLVVMPDHLHALIAFPPNRRMSTVVGSWKRHLAREHRMIWQSNYFDHRIRHTRELHESWAYLRRNPVAKGLCATPEAWP